MIDLETYRKALAAHDWFYDYADHHGTWRKGLAERIALVTMRRQVDPGGAVWNEFAPDAFKVQPA